MIVKESMAGFSSAYGYMQPTFIHEFLTQLLGGKKTTLIDYVRNFVKDRIVEIDESGATKLFDYTEGSESSAASIFDTSVVPLSVKEVERLSKVVRNKDDIGLFKEFLEKYGVDELTNSLTTLSNVLNQSQFVGYIATLGYKFLNSQLAFANAVFFEYATKRLFVGNALRQESIEYKFLRDGEETTVKNGRTFFLIKYSNVLLIFAADGVFLFPINPSEFSNKAIAMDERLNYYYMQELLGYDPLVIDVNTKETLPLKILSISDVTHLGASPSKLVVPSSMSRFFPKEVSNLLERYMKIESMLKKTDAVKEIKNDKQVATIDTGCAILFYEKPEAIPEEMLHATLADLNLCFDWLDVKIEAAEDATDGKIKKLSDEFLKRTKLSNEISQKNFIVKNGVFAGTSLTLQGYLDYAVGRRYNLVLYYGQKSKADLFISLDSVYNSEKVLCDGEILLQLPCATNSLVDTADKYFSVSLETSKGGFKSNGVSTKWASILAKNSAKKNSLVITDADVVGAYSNILSMTDTDSVYLTTAASHSNSTISWIRKICFTKLICDTLSKSEWGSSSSLFESVISQSLLHKANVLSQLLFVQTENIRNSQRLKMNHEDVIEFVSDGNEAVDADSNFVLDMASFLELGVVNDLQPLILAHKGRSLDLVSSNAQLRESLFANRSSEIIKYIRLPIFGDFHYEKKVFKDVIFCNVYLTALGKDKVVVTLYLRTLEGEFYVDSDVVLVSRSELHFPLVKAAEEELLNVITFGRLKVENADRRVSCATSDALDEFVTKLEECEILPLVDSGAAFVKRLKEAKKQDKQHVNNSRRNLINS